MSDVKRYDVVLCRPFPPSEAEWAAGMEESDGGGYVSVVDYDALAAERDRLAKLLREGVDNAVDREFAVQEWIERARAALAGAPDNE